MSNVLKPEKQEQIRALGRLGWSLRRIEEATKVRRETISRHLKAAGIALRPPRGRMAPAEPNAASHPIPDPGAESNAASHLIPDPGAKSNPASHPIPDLERRPSGGWSPMASSCEPYREWIEG